jgi:hypothetical protein
VRSSKLLAWRVCETESAHHVRLVFASLFEGWGIPVHCVLDNGRGFASKWITGGTANRFRFKVKDSDPVWLLTGLGVKVHWALPFHGQSKPIERAWMDLTDTISRHPFVAGAYTGRSPMHKPANYGSKAVPWDDFVGHVAREIAHHNARSAAVGATIAAGRSTRCFRKATRRRRSARRRPTNCAWRCWRPSRRW